jgi:hypothetical protein
MSSRNPNLNSKGVSLIAAIFIIVILGFMGVMFVSLISTGTMTAVNDMQAAQALSIAEGGVEFEQRALAQSLDWYRGTTVPLFTAAGNLGAGAFTATTRVPATTLRRRLLAGAGTAAVYTTGGFPPNGYLQIDDDVAAGAEFVQYTILNGNTFTLTARGRTIGTIATVANNFSRGTNVYPVTTLVDALANSCVAPASFRIAQNDKFLGAGIVVIEGEEIVYSGSSTAGGNTTLTGVQRCLNGAVSAAHNAGRPVTPLLAGGSADMQSEVTSTGAVGAAAVRVVRKTVQR